MFDAKKVVLVVTEDVAIRDMVLLTLSREGCLVQGAATVQTAQKIVDAEPPDIILLDLDSKHPNLGKFTELVQTLPLRLVVTTKSAKLPPPLNNCELLQKPFGPADVLRTFGFCAT